MTEEKTVFAMRGEEETVLYYLKSFGWTLCSYREINSVKAEKHRITMVFQRNTETKNYPAIVALEEKFNAIVYPQKNYGIIKPLQHIFIAGGILSGIIAFINVFIAAFTVGTGLIGGIVCGLLRTKKTKEYLTLCEKTEAKKHALLNQAQQLL